MSHPNLVLTLKAVKSHSKRVQKEMANLGQIYSLGESQTLFAKFLGFSHYQELKKVLENPPQNHSHDGLHTLDDFYAFVEKIEDKTDFIWFLGDGLISYRPFGIPLDDKKSYIQEKIFNKEDFQRFISLLLSAHDFLNIQEQPHDMDHHLVQLRRHINTKVVRHIVIQFYVKKGSITHAKLMLSYYNKEQDLQDVRMGNIDRKYSSIQHLL